MRARSRTIVGRGSRVSAALRVGCIALAAGTCASPAALAAPGDTLFYDNLNGNLSSWTIVEQGGDVSISNQTANQGRAMRLRWGPAHAYTDPIAAAVPGAELTAWIRRGADSFSENPEAGEDLLVEYRNAASNWVVLDTYAGDGTPGEIYTPTYTLPAAALHANLSVRFRLTSGSGSDFDYWHVDDVRVTETAGSGTPGVFYSLEEDLWTGAPGQVIDGSGGGHDGTVFGAATSDDASPALPTNPGSCRYGQFDGIDDYIEIADAPALDVATELTVAAWIYMHSLPPDLHTIVSKDWNYEFHVNASGQVYWWWNDSNGTVRSVTTASSIALNRWYHVAIVYRSGSQTIYVDGVPWATASYTGTLRLNDLPLFIGTDWNFISRAFDGFIDEVHVVSSAYSQAQVQALRTATHDCPSASAQFSINHDGFGIHCMAETITVDVVDSMAGTPLINYNAQVRLDTQSGNGTWTLVAGGGSLSDPVADDGLATYDWPLGESQARFALTYTQGQPLIDVDVYQVTDSGIRDTDAEGLLEFSANGFTLTAAPLSNPPPPTIVPFDTPQTAAVPFDVHLTAYGQTATDPVCGVIESYTGNKSLKFWSSYQNPTGGSRSVAVDGVAVATSEGTSSNQAVVFANGRAQIAGKYKDVGSIRLAVKDDTTVNTDLPAGIRGATASFVSRPARFVLSDIRNGTGTLVNPQAADAAGPVFVAAGTDFRATVAALDAEGDATPNYGQELAPENVRLDVELVAPVGGASPGLGATVGFGPFAGGMATGLDFRWGEVGIMRLRPGVGDGDYLGAGDVAGDVSESIGRFIPDHFAVSLNVPIFGTQCAAGGFTYTGQTFDYAVSPVITATAQAAGGNTTTNYAAAFFKLATGTLQNRAYASAAGVLDTSGLPPPSADPSVTESGAGIATIAFSDGAGLRFSRGVPAAPFDADISLSVDVLDADGVAALANPIVFDGASGIAFSAGTEIRYGRIRLANATGSELVDLALPLVAELFAGPATGFILNTADSCTSNVTLTLANYTESLSPGDTCVLDSGMPGASGEGCPAPAPPGGRFDEPPQAGDFNLTLAAPQLGNTGSVRIDASVPAWLRFDWDAGAPGDENPFGHASFGLYPGTGAQIYLREVY